MNITEVLAVIIANLAVLMSFADGGMINAKVDHEILPDAIITLKHRQHIKEMCKGAALLLGYFSNMAILLATSISGLISAPDAVRPYLFTIISVIFLFVFTVSWHIGARAKLSEVDSKDVLGPLSLGAILRIKLLILNTAVFVAISFSHPATIN